MTAARKLQKTSQYTGSIQKGDRFTCKSDASIVECMKIYRNEKDVWYIELIYVSGLVKLGQKLQKPVFDFEGDIERIWIKNN